MDFMVSQPSPPPTEPIFMKEESGPTAIVTEEQPPPTEEQASNSSPLTTEPIFTKEESGPAIITEEDPLPSLKSSQPPVEPILTDEESRSSPIITEEESPLPAEEEASKSVQLPTEPVLAEEESRPNPSCTEEESTTVQTTREEIGIPAAPHSVNTATDQPQAHKSQQPTPPINVHISLWFPFFFVLVCTLQAVIGKGTTDGLRGGRRQHTEASRGHPHRAGDSEAFTDRRTQCLQPAGGRVVSTIYTGKRNGDTRGHPSTGSRVSCPGIWSGLRGPNVC